MPLKKVKEISQFFKSKYQIIKSNCDPSWAERESARLSNSATGLEFEGHALRQAQGKVRNPTPRSGER